ncbi:DNA mismatch repair protein MutS [Aquibacillus sp. 3ASR75-11]|uniref:DNA mismatch repair protein MutS n=1 Tax=Terrihalobacillus insolitus TaxID=2950438 RepID=A0A9X4APQ8_9BACI|nr:DNA mismatch repair protein MutS [Terrihalobacillus insolitus]MDC3414337.1 DNA mismatch repair protein MutS [Terrihalobacillus insolitus]MDC3425813.1 DNA mismatch repair protein MutS [Terrihalobacillus insolitus]
MTTYTPMIQQYLKIKAQHKDAFLFFRLGDFYEMFFDDAIVASRELEITLTSRDGGSEERIPMCGIPYHSAENYIKNLIGKGYKVAICEQVEDPKSAKGVVKREVVQLITPGTVMEGNMLTDKENNYLASLSAFDDGTFVVAYNDLSTGENHVTQLSGGLDAVISELFNRSVKEMVVDSKLPEQYQNELQQRLQITFSTHDNVTIQKEDEQLTQDLHQEKMIQAFARLINYIRLTQKRSLHHLKPAQIIDLNEYMTLDMFSKRNLELTETIMRKGKHGSLLWVLDQTVTAMGARMLKKWLERPLLKKVQIEDRYDLVEGLLQQFFERESLREMLKSVYDLERLSGRVSYGNVNGRDFIQLKHSLSKIPDIKNLLSTFASEKVQALSPTIDPLTDLYDLLEQSLMNDPPVSIKEGGLIKDGFDGRLDDYRDASKNGKKWIAELEQREKQETGIKSLKIGYNRVFGYYIEITRANLHLLPEGKYERKQTLTNAERYVTPELKEKEALILEAEEKSVELEYELFIQLREKVKAYIPKLQYLADQISHLDVLQGFATVSEVNDYHRPALNEGRKIRIEKGRHPVIEKVMQQVEFVPNDVHFDDKTDMLLITGPNMSGKSTYMRQLALTAIMAQIGCYVPCDKADIPVFDQIFTRIGAADDLVSGQSTFMVEMLEAKHAITNATENSLILLDEIGRGTSTYDGMALAQAIMEYIHDNVRAKTLFSTHYHELTTLDNTLDRLRNVHVRAEEYNGNVVFLHQIHDGAADESYGIHVAKLAKLPQQLIERATDILADFEQKDTPAKGKVTDDQQQLSFFVGESSEKKQKKDFKKLDTELLRDLQSLNIMEMTPLEAMNVLYRLQKKAKQD